MANRTATATLWASRSESCIAPGAVEETETFSITHATGFVTTNNPIQGLANALDISIQETAGHADNGCFEIAWAAAAPQCVITVRGGAGTTSIPFVIIRNPHSLTS